MALNPPIDSNGNPYRIPNEFFILERNEIEFQIQIAGMGKLKGKGKSILTTHRIILINNN
jgi:hypothetical protein